MLDGLLFQPAGTDASHITHAGVPIYRGGAVGFDEWKFKILGKVSSIENQCNPHDEESATKMNNILVDLGSRSWRHLRTTLFASPWK